ncbi:MAG TPA: hypothetical protein VNV88_00085, partial [Candidatus Solibacter sp.]|nr:hypothetical protein [Candidatus Solibacter sp.]
MNNVNGCVRYCTRGGIEIEKTSKQLTYVDAIEPIIDALDEHPGVLLASSYEYPGRYTRWDIGFIDPPLRITSRSRSFTITALNDRGKALLGVIAAKLVALEAVSNVERHEDEIRGDVRSAQEHFPEDQRSKQFSIFSVLRGVTDLFFSSSEKHLGLYGAFGYDLAFQFEPIQFKQVRPADSRDLVVYLPDELIVVDHRRQTAMRYTYEFKAGSASTVNLPRTSPTVRYKGATEVARYRDHEFGAFSNLVGVAQEWFKRGDLFEVVPSQLFYEPCPMPPSTIFRRLRERNPAPYGTLMNLG